MAYQTRGRDPLLDSTMQAAIEKRGKELIGIGLVVLGVLSVLMFASYSPDDPNWMLASDAPVQNWLGRTGASLAQPMYMIGGVSVWGLPILLLTWGLRLTLHRGATRVTSRMVFAPIAIALAAAYAATLTAPGDWPHSFGVGGLFGDTVLGVLLTLVPLGPEVGLPLMSLSSGLAMLALGTFVLGFTWAEVSAAGRMAVYALIVLYEVLLSLAGRGADLSLRAAQGMQGRVQTGIAARRDQARAERALNDAEEAAARAVPGPMPAPMTQAQRVAAVVRANPAMPTGRAAETREAAIEPGGQALRRMPPAMGHTTVTTAPPPPAAAPLPAAAPRLAAPPRPVTEPAGGFMSRIPGLAKRLDPRDAVLPTPELVEAGAWGGQLDPDAAIGSDDRIKARISDAIRARSRTGDPAPRVEPQVTRPQRPQPLILPSTPSIPRGTPPMAAVRVAAPPVASPTGPAVTLDSVVARPPLAAPPVLERPVPREAKVLNRAPREGVPDLIEEDDLLVAVSEAGTTGAQRAAGGLPRIVPVAERRAVVQHPLRKPVPSSARARAESQPALPLGEKRHPAYEPPPLGLLTNPSEIVRHHLSDDALEENARMLESVLDDYGVKGEIVSVRPGPVVTMYELEPAPGLKASRVIGLADDIARSMSALSARVSTVPGRSVIGIELPNEKREMVVLREILSARDFGDSQMRLPLALGKDIGGEPIIVNLAKMPHLLIAGTTGSGKSVAINTMILSLLYKLTPEECRLIMIDPKMLELSVYDGIPHLLSPVVTDPKKAVVALKWTVGEMEDRYRKMSRMGVRNIEGYNGRVRDALSKGETFERTVQTGFDDETGDPIFESDEIIPEVLPYIVVIVDEMADLMMVAGKEIEACIQRLAQMARASGIHLIMATQRPSVDVITGTIKANFPTRISFQVTSRIDSRTILGEMGAEQLLGMGDMLYMAGGGKISRIHGPFCSDEEVEEIVTYLKGFGPPSYMSGVIEGPDEDTEGSIDAVLGLGAGDETENALYDMAVQIVAKDRKCSTSYIQRKLAIGYNKAARLVEQMEDQGVVSGANHVGKREVLVPEVH